MKIQEGTKDVIKRKNSILNSKLNFIEENTQKTKKNVKTQYWVVGARLKCAKNALALHRCQSIREAHAQPGKNNFLLFFSCEFEEKA